MNSAFASVSRAVTTGSASNRNVSTAAFAARIAKRRAKKLTTTKAQVPNAVQSILHTKELNVVRFRSSLQQFLETRE